MKRFTRVVYETLLLVSLALAHDNDVDMDTTVNMDMQGTSSITTPTGQYQGPTSYFYYGEHSSTILVHIVLMVIGWCFILPAGELYSTVALQKFEIPYCPPLPTAAFHQ